MDAVLLGIVGVVVGEAVAVVGDALALRRLEDEGDAVGLVVRADRDRVVVRGALEDLGHARQVDAQREVAVAALFINKIM